MKKLRSILEKINGLTDTMRQLSDADLRNKTVEFRQRLVNGESLDDLRIEAFAAVREAAYRATGLFPYAVQMLGGLILAEGKIAEMKTGEGKTLVAAMPAYLMALAGKGVHVVTVNDYLARRDAEDIGRIHRFMGLTVGCVQHDMPQAARRAAYACDITYVTNSELGFDYLRDNMVTQRENRAQRGLYYAIIDEVDSILIDEARTPLIISGNKSDMTDLYISCQNLVETMEPGEGEELSKLDAMSGVHVEETGDYVADEKNKTVRLTERGLEKARQYFNIANYSAPEHADLRHYMLQAMKANGLMHRDKDYVVRAGRVELVDEFTGRVLSGRRYADGLHQAIEAKEGVEIQPETQTLASITYQNFFNQYRLKSGMTGTGLSSAEEFRTIYGLRVEAVPTNQPVKRQDLPDVVYLTKQGKRNAVIQEILEAYKRKQPVLVGTSSIQESEIYSAMLTELHIKHSVLNAKNFAKEAGIIAHAGESGRITIATNMAGRGTDIQLTRHSRALGGLYVIGTERHEAKRIDDQLRGRAGRQGDPGKSRFFLSLEDDMMRFFGAKRTMNLLRNLGASEDMPLSHPALSRFIEKAQRKIEANNFGVRKALLDYDAVNNEHRELMYGQRDGILSDSDTRETVVRMARSVAESLVDKYFPGKRRSNWNIGGFQAEWTAIFGCSVTLPEGAKPAIRDAVRRQAEEAYLRKEASFGNAAYMRIAERCTLLHASDTAWTAHLRELELIRQSVNMIGYGQRNPVMVYRNAAYDALEEMLHRVEQLTVSLIFKARIQVRTVTQPVGVGNPGGAA